MKKIYFFTRDNLSQQYGTAIHLNDFLSILSLQYFVKVWELTIQDKFEIKLISTCKCPTNMSISRLNVICFKRFLHLRIDSLQAFLDNKYMPTVVRRIKEFPSLPLFILFSNFNKNLSNRNFDSQGMDFEIRLASLVQKQSSAHAVGTNYAWLSNLIINLNTKSFTFIHDLRSRNLDALRDRNFNNDSMKAINDELYFAFQNDFIITCNLQDQKAIEKCLDNFPVLHVTLSKKFLPVKQRSFSNRKTLRLIYVDAGGFGDFEIRKFLTKVWPRLISEFPECSLKIIGNVCNQIQDLKSIPNVSMETWVDELGAAYLESDLSLVLHFYRGGLKLKLFDALKHGVPVVASQAATDGLSQRMREAILGVEYVNFSYLLKRILLDENFLDEYFENQKKVTCDFLIQGYTSVLDKLN